MEHIEVISLVNLDDNVGNIRQLGGVEKVQLAITPEIRKPEGLPLAIVTEHRTVTMMYAGSVRLNWVEFEGTPEQVEQALKDCWDGLESVLKDVTKLEDSSGIQGVLFKDVANPLRMCLVAFPRPSIVDSFFAKPEA